MKSEIVVHLHAQPPSAGVKFLTQRTSDPAPTDSSLLRSIRTALKGSSTHAITSTYAPLFVPSPDGWLEQELAWSSQCAVLSHGGVIQRKWDFADEEQPIQYACLGRFAHTPDAPGPVHGSAHYTSTPAAASDEYTHTGPAADALFGPFRAMREREERPRGKLEREVVPAVFVFLRNIGKVFLANGVDYTFSLPFLVRKAWPLCPHGVVIQRLLEPVEMEEARLTGDVPLPTIFTITSLFAEPAAIGIARGIAGGYDEVPASLSDEDERCTEPPAVVSAAEEVIWVSPRGLCADDDILVTINDARTELSIWRYAYIKPKKVGTSVQDARMKLSFWVQKLVSHSVSGVS